MKSRRLKKGAVIGLYAMLLVVVLSVIYLTEGIFSGIKLNDKDDYEYVDIPETSEDLPVVSETEKIIRPYMDTEIKVLKNYYDYKASEDNQQQSITYYDGTYIQSSGVCYGGKDNFEIVSILPGKVINVKEDKVLGKIVEIEHEKDIISIYQSLGEVSVRKDDNVVQGQVIGKSGLSNIDKNLTSHVNFEMVVSGKTVNPEMYYDKNINEL